MKNYILVFLIFILATVVSSQQVKDIKIRDIDAANFQRIKIYTSILDEKDVPVTNLDSGKIIIKENETGKEYAPKPSIFYNSNEGMMICIAIDASNSMYGAPLNNVKQGLLKTLSDFRAVDKMGIAIFHDKFLKKSEFGNDREVLKNNIEDIQTGGSSTELFSSVIEAINWLKKYDTPKRKVLIIISDGDDNGNKYTIGNCKDEIEKSGISVFTIGSIEEKNETKGTLLNMDQLASASKDGKYFKINSTDDIKNIIPAIYDIIKKEYVIEYFSWAGTSKDITGSITINVNEKKYEKDFKYTSPKTLVENHPEGSFWKTQEFLYGAIGAGVVIAVLGLFIWLNVKKKKQYKREKEKEAQLREEESKESRERFDKLMNEYNNVLDQIEKQAVVSQSDKDKIDLLEKKMVEASKTVIGAAPSIDFRRKTQILSAKTSVGFNDMNINQRGAFIKIVSGFESGKQLMIRPEGILIGRQEGQFIVSDNSVSRKHAKIYSSTGGFMIEDLGSTNGTYVNNYRISTSSIKNGDRIRLGNVELLFTAN